jgi:hypothetical protein
MGTGHLSLGGPRLGQSIPVDSLDGEAAVRGHPDQVAEKIQKNRLAVRRERHHLVLVAGVQKAEMAGQVLVKQAQ